jgi:RNA polymerase-binding transcription factor DksA
MNNKYFDEEFLHKQKESLEKEKKRLEDDLKETSGFPKYGDTEEDNAMEVEDFETNKELSTDAKTMLRQVDNALKAIKEGTYGLCGTCNNPIERARLEAYPAVTTCLEHSKK